MLTVLKVSSQNGTKDTICFDVTTVKKVALDLHELDRFRSLDTLKKTQLQNLQIRLSSKDSLITNLNLQSNFKQQQLDNSKKQIELLKKVNGNKGWMKWFFLFVGSGLTYLIAN